MTLSAASVVSIAAIFVFAGIVKGVSGMGLPTVSIGLLGLVMAPAEAAALVVVPSLVTNVWQFVAGPRRLVIIRRLWPMLLAIAAATWASTGLMVGGNTARAAAALGAVLALYAIVGLSRYRLAVPGRAEPWLAPVVGAATGVVTGATGVFAIPAVPYLQAIGLETEDLVQALGLSFTVSSIALAAGLASRGAFQPAAGGLSSLCIVPALAGMVLGQWVRTRIDPLTFRRVFLVGLLLLGADLVARAVL